MSVSILEFLRVNGEQMEAEIAKAMQMPMTLVQSQLAQLSTAGEVVCCRVTRYRGGTKIEGTSYRLSRTTTGKPLQPGPPRTR